MDGAAGCQVVVNCNCLVKLYFCCRRRGRWFEFSFHSHASSIVAVVFAVFDVCLFAADAFIIIMRGLCTFYCTLKKIVSRSDEQRFDLFA